MARPKKIGFDYFPFDVDLFSDYKVRKLMRHQGGSQAVTVYALLLCNIYRNGYYLRWDSELPFFMSETLGLKEAYIADVIQYCTAVGLLDKELYDKENVLTSRGIQRRYLLICQQTRRTNRIKEYCLISSEEMGVSSAKTAVSSEEMVVSSAKTAVSSEESTQKKRKEKKKKENKFSLSLGDESPEEKEKIDFGKFQEYYNYCVDYYHSRLAKLDKISDDRQRAVNSLLNKGYTKDDTGKVIRLAATSTVFNDNTSRHSFTPDFDWIFEEKNFLRILEGNYNR